MHEALERITNIFFPKICQDCSNYRPAQPDSDPMMPNALLDQEGLSGTVVIENFNQFTEEGADLCLDPLLERLCPPSEVRENRIRCSRHQPES
jgi:hypothetical protein